VNAGNDTTFCTGFPEPEYYIGSIKIHGGTPPYKYSWSGTYNNEVRTYTAKELLTDTAISNPRFKDGIKLGNDEWLNLSISVTDSDGLIAVDEKKVRFSRFAFSLIDNVVTVKRGDSLQFSHYFFVGGIQPLTFVKWSPEIYLSDQFSLNTWCKPIQDQQYLAVVKDSVGCVAIGEGYNVKVSTTTGVNEGTNAINSCASVQQFYTNAPSESEIDLTVYSLDGKYVFNGPLNSSLDDFVNNHFNNVGTYIINVNTKKDNCTFRLSNQD
jgi:hypothetical protein